MQKRKRFGEILVEARVVSEAALAEALMRQRISKQRLGKVLEDMGVVTERDIAAALARQFGFKTVSNIAKAAIGEKILGLVDEDWAMSRLIFPLKVEGNSLYLAMVNPLDIETIDKLAFKSGLQIVPFVTTPTEIHAAVKRHHQRIPLQIELTERSAVSDLELPPGVDRSRWTRWKILVVDDQETDLAAIQAALSGVDYDLSTAANGVDGLRLAIQHPPHLVISDTVMPRMDGYDLFRTLQANPQTAHIPVIALSSRSNVEEEARLLDMGYCDFIAKPVSPVRLAARVRHALRLIYGGVPPSR